MLLCVVVVGRFPFRPGAPGFEEKMAELSAELYDQMAEGEQLDAAIGRNLVAIGYGE